MAVSFRSKVKGWLRAREVARDAKRQTALIEGLLMLEQLLVDHPDMVVEVNIHQAQLLLVAADLGIGRIAQTIVSTGLDRRQQALWQYQMEHK